MEARTLIAPAITPEQLYKQDKRKRESDENERSMRETLRRLYQEGRVKNPPGPARWY